MKSKVVTSQMIFRVVDANFNRAKEGLRVCEDVARFVWDDKGLTASFKTVRHALTEAAAGFGIDQLVVARDIVRDVGKGTVKTESLRSSVGDVFRANLQRVKESLRVLEEFAKLIDIHTAEKLKALRYRIYDLEKTAFGRC